MSRPTIQTPWTKPADALRGAQRRRGPQGHGSDRVRMSTRSPRRKKRSSSCSSISLRVSCQLAKAPRLFGNSRLRPQFKIGISAVTSRFVILTPPACRSGVVRR